MTKEHRAELTALKKQQRALTREEDAAARLRRKQFATADTTLRRGLRSLEKLRKQCERAFEAAKKSINRTSAKLHSGFAKRGRAIAERIAILEGRLS